MTFETSEAWRPPYLDCSTRRPLGIVFTVPIILDARRGLSDIWTFLFISSRISPYIARLSFFILIDFGEAAIGFR